MPKLRTKQNNKRKTICNGFAPAEWGAYCQATGVHYDPHPDLWVTYLRFPGHFPYAIQEQAGQPTFRMFENLSVSVQFSAPAAGLTPTPTKLVILEYSFLLGVDLRFDAMGVGNLDYPRLMWAVSLASCANSFGGVSVPVVMTAPDEEQELLVRVVLNQNSATPAEFNSLILTWLPQATAALQATADFYFDNDAWAAYTKAIVGAGVTVPTHRTPALCI